VSAEVRRNLSTALAQYLDCAHQHPIPYPVELEGTMTKGETGLYTVPFSSGKQLNLSVERDTLKIEFLHSSDSKSIMHLEWKGVELPKKTPVRSDQLVELLSRPPDQKTAGDLSLVISEGNDRLIVSQSSQANGNTPRVAVQLNGYVVPLDHDRASQLISEMASLFKEAFAHISRPLNEADQHATAVPRSEEYEGMDYTNVNKVMNTICFVAGSTVSIWPIGTLIAGPTAVGCIYWYASGGGTGGGKKDAGGKPPLDVVEAP
jgi:hypothetical protein